MAIKIEDIVSALEPEHWKLISTSYSNLNDELEFECDEGHRVYSSWGRIRIKRECPICRQNRLKNISTAAVPKDAGEFRVLALDQATHISGWAVYNQNGVLSYGTFEADENKSEIERFSQVKDWMVQQIYKWDPDLIATEGIQYQPANGVTTFQTLARLQGILMEACFEIKRPFRLCPTNTWRNHCGVKGKTRCEKKSSMRRHIKEWYDISVGEDEADALGIGKYAIDTLSSKRIIKDFD